MITREKTRINKIRKILDGLCESRWETLSKRRDAWIANAVNKSSLAGIFSDQYFNSIADRLEKTTSLYNKMLLFSFSVASVLLFILLHRDISISILGASIANVSAARDFVVFVYVNASMITTMKWLDIGMLQSILKCRRIDKLPNEYHNIYLARFTLNFIVDIDLFLAKNWAAAPVPAGFSFWVMISVMMMVVACMFFILISIACFNFGIIGYSIFTLIVEPGNPQFMSYFTAVYAAVAMIFEFFMTALDLLPLRFVDRSWVEQFTNMNERRPGMFYENLRIVRERRESAIKERK